MRYLLPLFLFAAGEAWGQPRLADELIYPTNPPRYVVPRNVAPRLEVSSLIYPGQTLAQEEAVERTIMALRTQGLAADHPRVWALESTLGLLKSQRYEALRTSERALATLKDLRRKADSPEKAQELDTLILRMQSQIRGMTRS